MKEIWAKALCPFKGSKALKLIVTMESPVHEGNYTLTHSSGILFYGGGKSSAF